MIEIHINRLPGGDESRRSPIARITLTNTGEGLGGVKIYHVQVPQSNDQTRAELTASECRAHREPEDGVLRLIQRAFSRLTQTPS